MMQKIEQTGPLNKKIAAGLLAAAVMVSAGCAAAPKMKAAGAEDNHPQSIRSQTPTVHTARVQPPAEGSLWNDSSELLFVDRKARKVGDTVIVDVVENTSSSMEANTKAEKSNEVDLGIPHLMGYMRALEAMNRNLNRGTGGSLTDKLISARTESEFEGKGTSDRSGRITASVGATVVKVLDNGNLVIKGQRQMKVNNETQIITVSGIARPEDVGTGNRIESTYLANATITYAGKGVLAEAQAPGWLARILSRAWPF
ncbi:MAG: flagellar basal body L-ring protein FlgH [Thermodesulfobacteriota bacterium]|nr:flagellar basal body L-ring protein FlgH [Thermodesulfobacteriota bacterium]